MQTLITILYFVAITSSVLFLLKLALMALGGGHDGGAFHDTGDVAHDASEAAQFKFISTQMLITLFMFGGWFSLMFIQGMHWEPLPGIALGAAIGLAMGLLFSYGMYSLRKLESDGTIRDFKAEGLKGTCYLRVPEAGKGKGQVQIVVKNRTLTLDAVSDGPAIESFKKVVVMQRIDENTLRVCETE
jgi:hypothetical protein